MFSIEKIIIILYNKGMRVYRYLNKIELNHILNGDISKLGSFFVSQKYKFNSHHYKDNEKYIHFFKDKSSMLEIRNLYRFYDEKFYFCAFEIPFTKLMFHKGTGYYASHGYDCPIESLTEFALPIKNFKPEWLSGYVIDQEKFKTMSKENIEEIFEK